MVNDDALINVHRYNGCPWMIRAGKIKELGLDKACELAYLEYDPTKYDMSSVWVCQATPISKRKTLDYEGSYVYLEAILLDPRLPDPPYYELKYPYILVDGEQFPWDNFFDLFAGIYRQYPLEFLMEHLGRESVVRYVEETGNPVPVNLEEFDWDTRYIKDVPTNDI